MIVIPMAGESRRFLEAGYKIPKFQLLLVDQSLFFWALAGFSDYFESEKFLFICLKQHGVRDFIEQECLKLGISRVQIVEVESLTRGQAETVSLGFEIAQTAFDERLLIFNIDTIRKSGTKIPLLDSQDAGSLEVFSGEGEHWSFVEPKEGASFLANKVTEKVRVSNLCSSGLYLFSNLVEFNEAYQNSDNLGWSEYPERFVAPLYNYFISKGKRVSYFITEIEQLFFSGTPSEFVALNSNTQFQQYAESYLSQPKLLLG